MLQYTTVYVTNFGHLQLDSSWLYQLVCTITFKDVGLVRKILEQAQAWADEIWIGAYGSFFSFRFVAAFNKNVWLEYRKSLKDVGLVQKVLEHAQARAVEIWIGAYGSFFQSVWIAKYFLAKYREATRYFA